MRNKTQEQVMELYAIGGEPPAIARHLGIPEGTVRTAVRKIMSLPMNFYEVQLIACAKSVRAGRAKMPTVPGLYTRKRRVRRAALTKE